MKEIIIKVLKKSPYDYFMYLKHHLKRNSADEIIGKYLSNNKQPKLQIGCGTYTVEGWLNTDLNPCSDKVALLDASKKFPFNDNTFDFIFSEHIFEHLKFNDSCNMLSECFRVLKPNGIMRLATPTIEFLFEIYKNPELPLHEEYVKWVIGSINKDVANLFSYDFHEIYVINNFYRDWGHQFLHNYDSLSELLKKFNFSNIQKREIGVSDFVEFSDMEKHGDVISDKFNKLETLVIEAKK